MNDKHSKDWWIVITIACTSFIIPFLFIPNYSLIAFIVWCVLVMIYFTLLHIFSTSFAIEGAIVIFALAVFVAVLIMAIGKISLQVHQS
jgi:hypothetical protein